MDEIQFRGKNLDANKFYEMKYFLTEEQKNQVMKSRIQELNEKSLTQIGEEDRLDHESSYTSNMKKRPESPKKSLLRSHLDSMELYRKNEMETY